MADFYAAMLRVNEDSRPLSRASARNPRTGAEVNISAARLPKFRAGKALKDAIN